MIRALRWYDTITINIYWLALSSISNTLTPLVVPLLVQQFVGAANQGTAYGNLRLWTLMAALLFQSLFGMLSDRSQLRFGRRRPFILVSSVFELVIISFIGFSADLSGMTGYWVLFFLIVMSNVASNMAQAAVNGLIPDLVPEKRRGLFSGVKAVLEVPLPLILVSLLIARIISNGNMWGGILIVMGIVTIATVIAMFVPEQSSKQKPPALDWKPFLRLLLMTGLFTATILSMGVVVRQVGSWLEGISSTVSILAITGVVGLLGMVIAVGIGVWMSSAVGLGQAVNKNPSFTWWIINRLAYLVGVTNLSSFTIYFLQARLGYVREKAASPAAMLTMFVGIFILVSALPSGWLADRFGHKRLVGVSGVLAAFGTLVAIASPSLIMIYVGGCLIGIATGLFFTANWALGTDIVPKGEAGRYLGIANLAGAGAGAIGAFIGGPIADQITRQLPQMPGMGYLLLFAIYGLMFLLSTVALRGVSQTSSEEQLVQPVLTA